MDAGTGALRVLSGVLVADAGTLINPAIVRGQLLGAAVQGLGGAMFEEVVYSVDGVPLVTTLMDYLLPTACEAPPFEVHLLQDHPSNSPLGTKGVGELGIVGLAPAIANAVADALGEPAARRLTRIPLTPQRVLEAALGSLEPAP